ncbi:hypothetical protein AHF37_01698 [Paragonimus kellicotti]|nr:hypothetical protein AHF37_01698 [Paragonimus kellicotti]
MEFNTLPLPPNWETRFDVELQRWFFVDHANKSTSWEDPRPAYYAAHPPDTISPITSVEGVGRTVKQSENNAYHTQSSTMSDSAYCVIDSEPEQPLSSKYLGESDALKKFVSRYVHRKSSGASGRRDKQASSSSSRQNSGSNYKKEYVPYVVEMQAEASRDSRINHRPTISQPWKYDSNVQAKDHDGLTTGASRSLSVREPVLNDITKLETDKSTPPDAVALSSTLVSLICSVFLYSDRFRLFVNRTVVRD